MSVEPNSGDLQESELIGRCLRRPVDEEAWNIFYNRHYDFVRSIVYRTTGGAAQEIADLVQDGFAKIFQGLAFYDPKKAGLRTYISHVVRNAVIDRLRHGRAMRESTVGFEAQLVLFQFRAARDPQLALATASMVVDRLGDQEAVDIVEDLVNGKTVKEISKRRQVKSARVYEVRDWFRSVLNDVIRSRDP
jgi:RNA polymerase sigma factor (sigma-70 family)